MIAANAKQIGMPSLWTRNRGRVLLLLLLVGSLAIVAVKAASWYSDQRWQHTGLLELEAAARQSPEDARILRYLALRLEQAGRDREAFDVFTRAAATDNDDETIWLGAARLSARLYGPQGALDLLSFYLKKHPDNTPARLALAEIYLRCRSYRRVREEAVTVLHSDPRNSDAFRLKGIAEMSLNQLPDAERSLLQAAAPAPQSGDVSFALAGVYTAQHRVADAEAAYRRAIAQAPGQPMPHLAFAKLLLDSARTREQLEEARSEAERAVALTDKAYAAPLLLGQIDARLGRFTEAEKNLLQAKRLSAIEATVAYELARVYQRTGDTAKAASELARFRQLSYYAAEKRLLIERLSQNESDSVARLKLARMAADSGDLEEATRQYRLLQVKKDFRDIADREGNRLTAR